MGTSPRADSATLADQLDRLLFEWLERHAGRGGASRPGRTSAAILTVAEAAAAEVERVCDRWGLRTRRIGGGPVMTIDGPELPVLGLAEIAALLRG
jgi:hypothetical protein